TEVLAEEPAIEVVGAAANGKIALARLVQSNPDVVILDVEMPEMDGLEPLRELRKTHPRLPVIMFSALTDRGAALTLDAPTAAAKDSVTTPVHTGSQQAARQHIRDQLIPKILGLCGAAPLPPVALVHPAPAAARAAAGGLHRVEAVVIGVSTGGPNALAE